MEADLHAESALAQARRLHSIPKGIQKDAAYLVTDAESMGGSITRWIACFVIGFVRWPSNGDPERS